MKALLGIPWNHLYCVRLWDDLTFHEIFKAKKSKLVFCFSSILWGSFVRSRMWDWLLGFSILISILEKMRHLTALHHSLQLIFLKFQICPLTAGHICVIIFWNIIKEFTAATLADLDNKVFLGQHSIPRLKKITFVHSSIMVQHIYWKWQVRKVYKVSIKLKELVQLFSGRVRILHVNVGI